MASARKNQKGRMSEAGKQKAKQKARSQAIHWEENLRNRNQRDGSKRDGSPREESQRKENPRDRSRVDGEKTEAVLTDARRRIVDLLKREGPVTAAALAASLGLTKVAVRQHLQGLEALGLAEARPQPAAGRGRPSRAWTLSPSAASLFPDRHGELTVGLLDAMRQALGQKGVDQVLQKRARQQTRHYRSLLPSPKASLLRRVQALAQLRSDEGYLAEVVQEKPGTYLLIEHHCPICEAAQSCLGLCETELQVFTKALGPGVVVERCAHLLSGAERCVYRVRKAR